MARKNQKNIFKKYLLWVASDTPNATGVFAVGICLEATLVGILVSLLTDNPPTIPLVIMAILGKGIFIVLLQNWLAMNFVSFNTTRSPGKKARPRGIFIRTDENGKVLAYGNPLWGKENTHWVLIPEERWIYLFRVRLAEVCARRFEGDPARVEFQAYLYSRRKKIDTQNPTFNGFDLQEVYEKVVTQGFESVETWIMDFFRRETMLLRELRATFEPYNNTSLSDAMCTVENALKTVYFPEQPLKNLIFEADRIPVVAIPKN